MLCAVLAGCGFNPEQASSGAESLLPEKSGGENQYISEAELGEAAAADKSYFEPFIELSSSKMEYVYLYVVDESGNPVKNINCFNRGQWDEYLSDGGGKRSGVSMPGGLLPIPLYGYIGYIEGNELELILANCDAEGKAITQNIIVELDRLKGGEICKAVWAEETPDSSAENRSDSITVTVKAPSGKDFSRYIVYVTGHNENQQEAFPAIGAAYSGSFAVKNLSEEKTISSARFRTMNRVIRTKTEQ